MTASGPSRHVGWRAWHATTWHARAAPPRAAPPCGVWRVVLEHAAHLAQEARHAEHQLDAALLGHQRPDALHRVAQRLVRRLRVGAACAGPKGGWRPSALAAGAGAGARPQQIGGCQAAPTAASRPSCAPASQPASQPASPPAVMHSRCRSMASTSSAGPPSLTKMRVQEGVHSSRHSFSVSSASQLGDLRGVRWRVRCGVCGVACAVCCVLCGVCGVACAVCGVACVCGVARCVGRGCEGAVCSGGRAAAAGGRQCWPQAHSPQPTAPLLGHATAWQPPGLPPARAAHLRRRLIMPSGEAYRLFSSLYSAQPG
jgi:hypothetical protein